jgi:PTS system N-acetylglucosamine-specific IIC component
MLTAPVLYFLYALLYGLFSYPTAVSGFRAGFAFSAGATDLLFSAALPAAQKTWLIVPLGAAAFLSFYLLFRMVILRFDVKTPGREASDTDSSPETPSTALPLVEGVDLALLLEGLGGRDNVVRLDHCITRLRMEVRDAEAVREALLLSAGAKGVFQTGTGSVQVVIGTRVQRVAESLKKLL